MICLLVHSPDALNSQGWYGPGQSQELGILCRFTMWVVETQTFEPSSAVSQDVD